MLVIVMFNTDLDPEQNPTNCKKARIEDSANGKQQYLYELHSLNLMHNNSECDTCIDLFS